MKSNLPDCSSIFAVKWAAYTMSLLTISGGIEENSADLHTLRSISMTNHQLIYMARSLRYVCTTLFRGLKLYKQMIRHHVHAHFVLLFFVIMKYEGKRVNCSVLEKVCRSQQDQLRALKDALQQPVCKRVHVHYFSITYKFLVVRL